EQELPDAIVHVHAQSPANLRGSTSSFDGRLLDRCEVRNDALVVPKPIVSQGNRARGAPEETHTQAIFEASNGATDRGLRETERFPRAREASRFDDCTQDAEAVQQMPIEPPRRTSRHAQDAE